MFRTYHEFEHDKAPRSLRREVRDLLASLYASYSSFRPPWVHRAVVDEVCSSATLVQAMQELPLVLRVKGVSPLSASLLKSIATAGGLSYMVGTVIRRRCAIHAKQGVQGIILAICFRTLASDLLFRGHIVSIQCLRFFSDFLRKSTENLSGSILFRR